MNFTVVYDSARVNQLREMNWKTMRTRLLQNDRPRGRGNRHWYNRSREAEKWQENDAVQLAENPAPQEAGKINWRCLSVTHHRFCLDWTEFNSSWKDFIEIDCRRNGHALFNETVELPDTDGKSIHKRFSSDARYMMSADESTGFVELSDVVKDGRTAPVSEMEQERYEMI